MRSRNVLVLFVALAIFLSFWQGSCKKSVSEDDGNTPWVVVDLQAAYTTDSTILLVWTATGDDSNSGTAASYDLRILDEPIGSGNFDSAVPLAGEPKPRVAGSIDSFLVTGLEKDSTYYFLLRTCDEASNCALSNCASASCWEDIVITFPDPHLSARIRQAISKPTGEIHRSDLMPLWNLDLGQDSISDLTGMEYCTNLTQLFLNWNKISDLTPLSNLRKLLDVQIVANDLTSFPALAGWTSVRGLTLAGNNLTDISGVSGLTGIHMLNLAGNQIQDLAPLVANSGLGSGDSIWVENNPLSQTALTVQIPALEGRGVTVTH